MRSDSEIEAGRDRLIFQAEIFRLRIKGRLNPVFGAEPQEWYSDVVYPAWLKRANLPREQPLQIAEQEKRRKLIERAAWSWLIDNGLFHYWLGKHFALLPTYLTSFSLDDVFIHPIPDSLICDALNLVSQLTRENNTLPFCLVHSKTLKRIL
jgi:hypothetical protein